MPQQSVEFEHYRMTVRGTVYRPDKPGRHPAVLLLHGFTGNRIESGFLFVKLGRALAQRGIVAAAFDFRHSGESDGSFEKMLVTGELSDALKMTDWLQGQPYVDRSRMGVLGFSLGGLLAASVTAKVNAYKALVLWAPTTVNNLCRLAGQAEPGMPVTRGVHVLNPKFFDDIRTIDSIGDSVKHPRQTLLVQGTADTAVAPAVSQEYVDVMRKHNIDLTVEMIGDADHGFSKLPQRTRLLDVTVDWLENRLL